MVEKDNCLNKNTILTATRYNKNKLPQDDIEINYKMFLPTKFC